MSGLGCENECTCKAAGDDAQLLVHFLVVHLGLPRLCLHTGLAVVRSLVLTLAWCRAASSSAALTAWASWRIPCPSQADHAFLFADLWHVWVQASPCKATVLPWQADAHLNALVVGIGPSLG